MCTTCRTWRQTHPVFAECVRCRHPNNVNVDDGLCRLCLIAIRLTDPGWPADRQVAGNQLMLLLDGVRFPHPQPIVKNGRRIPGTIRPKRRPRGTPVPIPPDDPRICPPTTLGQQILFATPERQLDLARASQILGRRQPGYEQAVAAAGQYAQERGASVSLRDRWQRLLRLVLAARDADGEQLVADTIVDQLSECAQSVREILRRAEQLVGWQTRQATDLGSRIRRQRPHAQQPTVSCADCDSWGPDLVCGGCRGWRKAHPAGRCTRCHRHCLPLVATLCRGCTITLAETDLSAADGGETQLWFGGPLAPRLYQRKGALGYRPTRGRARARERARRAAPLPVSDHLVDPHQLILIDPRRDWDSLTTSSAAPPSLTASAAALLSRLDAHARDQGWNLETLAACRHTLRILLAHFGADDPIRESDVRGVAGAGPKGSAHRALHFLTAHHAVIADPARQISAHERFIETSIASLPTGIATELHRWVEVQRGLGRRTHPSLDWQIIRNYLASAVPVLEGWADRADSLREITPHDVAIAIAGSTGNAAQARRTALRSIFRALKQERLIFADPTRRARLTAVPTLPSPLSSDALRGLLDRVDSHMGRLAVALVAVHALGVTDLRQLRLADLDATRGRLRLARRKGRDHVVYLDTVSHRAALTWLKTRHDNWPRTANDHLLVTGHSAISPDSAPVAAATLRRHFRVVGIRASHLRQDRILHEAALTADPVHLIRLFGISSATAMHYVAAAHPERRA